MFSEHPNDIKTSALEKTVRDSLCGMEVSKQLEEEFYIIDYKPNKLFLKLILNFCVNIGFDPIYFDNRIQIGDKQFKAWTPRKFSLRLLNKMKKDIKSENRYLYCSK